MFQNKRTPREIKPSKHLPANLREWCQQVTFPIGGRKSEVHEHANKLVIKPKK